MSPNLNVLWGTPITNFLGQVFRWPCGYASFGTRETQVSTVELGMLWPHRTSKSCHPWVRVGAHGTITLRPGSRFSLGTACLVVPEKLGLTFPGAKSSRLGLNSLLNVTSLRNKGTPNPSILPSSRVNWEWSRARLVKDTQYPSRRRAQGHPREEWLLYQDVLPFLVWRSVSLPEFRIVWNVSSATPPTPDYKSLRVLGIFSFLGIIICQQC